MENSEIIELLGRMKKDCNEKCGIFLQGSMNSLAFEMRGKAEAFETVVLMLENPEYFRIMKEKFLS